MKKKLSGITRLLLLFAAAGLVLVLFTPIWRIDLDAPQYPEGLSLKIHAKGLKGNVDIVNGLNHYIGMKTLHDEDFIEFTVLPFCILFFTAFFITVAIVNRESLLITALILFVAFGLLAMYDFWRWEFDYGHNLNPDAAIKVPGMAYQPPLIGFKQLLNFGAYSIPDTGGWIFIAAGVLLVICVVVEWRRNKQTKITFALFLFLSPLLSNSCTARPEPINVGTDNCYFCKMTISDTKYGGELVSKKGRHFKFDDIYCLRQFTKANMLPENEVKVIYLVDYGGIHSLVKMTDCFLLQGGSIKAPMNGDVIAFKSKEEMAGYMQNFNATVTSWQQLIK
jgi:copper chaperone NosL